MALRAGFCRWTGVVGRWGWMVGFGVLCAGVAPIPAQDVLIPEGDLWRYFKGVEEPPADWNRVEFDDSGWLEGSTPIGYSSDLTYRTILDDMRQVSPNPGYHSVYIRRLFTVDDPDQILLLNLRMKYDDGFLAYLNGVEIQRVGLDPPGSAVPFDTLAAEHETNTAFQDFSLGCDAAELLVDGDNVLAIQGHNTSLTSSDFTLEVELQAVSDFCPTAFAATVSGTEDAPTVRLDWQIPPGVTYESLVLFRDGEEITLTSPAMTRYIDSDVEPGVYVYELVATICGKDCIRELSVPVGGGSVPFRRGDADSNALVNLTDAVYILLHLFRGGAAPTCVDAADTNDDGQLNLTDSVYLLQALFQGGAPPPSPGMEECGTDPPGIQDSFEECVYPSC